MSNGSTKRLAKMLFFGESTLQAQILKHIICTLFPMVQGGCVAYTITDMIRRPTTKATKTKYLVMEWIGLLFACIGWILNTLIINNSLMRSGRRHQASIAVIVGQFLPAIPWALYGIGLALEQSFVVSHKTPASVEVSIIELFANLCVLAYWRTCIIKSKKKRNPFIKKEVESNDYVGPTDGYEAPDSPGYQVPAVGRDNTSRMQPTMPHTLPPNTIGNNGDMNLAEMPSLGPPLDDNAIESDVEVHHYEDNYQCSSAENRGNPDRGRTAEMPVHGPPSEGIYKSKEKLESEEQSVYQ